MYDIFVDQETSLDRGLFYAVSAAVNWTAPSDAVTWTAPSDVVTWTAPSDAAPDPDEPLPDRCRRGPDSRLASQGPSIDQSIIICFK